MYYAIESNDIPSVKELIASGVDLEEPDLFTTWTPLEFSIQSNKNEIAKLLIDAGVRIHGLEEKQTSNDSFINSSWSALAVATWSNNIEIVEYLLLKGANTNDIDMHFAFLEAAKNAYLKVMQLLIGNDFNVNAYGNRGPLLFVLLEEECPIVSIELLLKNGANPNASYQGHDTALELTPSGYNLDTSLIDLLFEYGSIMIPENIKSTIRRWASSKALIKSVYIFGSRARNDYHHESDLDIAIELLDDLDESGGLASWMEKSDKWTDELSSSLPYEVQLELYDGEKTEIIHKGIQRSSLCIYTKMDW